MTSAAALRRILFTDATCAATTGRSAGRHAETKSVCAAHTRLRWRSSMRRTTARAPPTAPVVVRRRSAALCDLVERAQRVVELHDVQLLKLVEHRPVLEFRRGVLRIVLEDLEPATVQPEVDATAAERAVQFAGRPAHAPASRPSWSRWAHRASMSRDHLVDSGPALWA